MRDAGGLSLSKRDGKRGEYKSGQNEFLHNLQIPFSMARGILADGH